MQSSRIMSLNIPQFISLSNQRTLKISGNKNSKVRQIPALRVIDSIVRFANSNKKCAEDENNELNEYIPAFLQKPNLNLLKS